MKWFTYSALIAALLMISGCIVMIGGCIEPNYRQEYVGDKKEQQSIKLIEYGVIKNVGYAVFKDEVSGARILYLGDCVVVLPQTKAEEP